MNDHNFDFSVFDEVWAPLSTQERKEAEEKFIEQLDLMFRIAVRLGREGKSPEEAVGEAERDPPTNSK